MEIRSISGLRAAKASLLGVGLFFIAALSVLSFSDQARLALAGGTAVAAEQAAYFKFDYPPYADTFVIKLTDPQKIQQARDALAKHGTYKVHVIGTIVKSPASYNHPWSFYLDPSTIGFFEMATEVCDSTIRGVEEHLDEVGGSFLPNSRWCPWRSRLLTEVFPHALQVTNGSGSGSYLAGEVVTIAVNPSISEKVFDRWTGDIGYISDATSPSTQVTMPDKAITLIAIYKDSPAYFPLQVKNGFGSGAYPAGSKVTVKANPAITSQVFDKWTGDVQYLSSATEESATVTMPDRAVAIAATYKEAVPASCQPDGGIKDGAMMRVRETADVYIAKYANCKRFKRLILSPRVLESYHHLKWKDVIEVDQVTLDIFTTSDLVRTAGENRVWKLEPAGDTGAKHVLGGSYDADSVYEINSVDRDSYLSA